MTVKEAGFVSKVGTLARKDLRAEARARDTLPPMLAFSFAVLLVLAFTLPETERVARSARADVLAGFLWITILFAGLIGFARTFESEKDEGALDSLLLVPLDRSGLFLAKAGANLIYVVALEVFIVPLFALIFDIDLGIGWPGFLLVVVLADIGFVLIGTLFSAVAAHTRSKELILPLLSLPTLVPVFIAATELTSDLFLGSGLALVAERGWFGILAGFDLLFIVVGSLAFEFTID
ncbi:MAG: heme exporter protein CcmB [Actinomycetota bacterium]|nr:heme exporter protein CcmB [Actinomycetota bacterium]